MSIFYCLPWTKRFYRILFYIFFLAVDKRYYGNTNSNYDLTPDVIRNVLVPIVILCTYSHFHNLIIATTCTLPSYFFLPSYPTANSHHYLFLRKFLQSAHPKFHSESKCFFERFLSNILWLCTFCNENRKSFQVVMHRLQVSQKHNPRNVITCVRIGNSNIYLGQKISYDRAVNASLTVITLCLI